MNKDTPLKDTILFILSVSVVSYILVSILCPDLWFFNDRRVLSSHDSLVPWESTFILVSHFFHGGIQLGDRFDQMNEAYFILSNGVYGIANIITAFIFIILSPFIANPGEALYHMHLFLFYGLTCLIRTIGGYLLLRKFVSDKTVIFVALLYLNTMLTAYTMLPGIVTQAVYSFFPLLLYFILSFFENISFRSFLVVVLVMTLSFVNSPLFALGYYYQVIHFFIISCVIAFVCQRGWRRPAMRQPFSEKELLKNIVLTACCFFIMLPYLWWGHALTHDFYVHGSGLGGTQGRFNNIFNLSKYFTVFGKGFANPLEFLGTSLDYHHNFWTESWTFIGGSSLCLSIAGLVLSKDRRKYIFAGTFLFVMLINTACYPENFFALGQYIKYALQNPSGFWGSGIHLGDWILYLWLWVSSIAHGINALTNPFSFLVRSFHMASLLTPMLFLPLIAMGIDACRCLWQSQDESIHFNRRWFLALFYAVVFMWALSGGAQSLNVCTIGQSAAPTLKLYILSISSIFFFLIVMAEFFAADRSWVGWMILGCACLVDFTGLMTYVQLYQKDYIAPTRLSPCYTHQAIVPDYQNPKILPVREFFNADKSIIAPVIDVFQGMFGAFYEYTPMGRFFRPWTLYEPRQMIYRDLYPDIEIQQYLATNPRSMFFADYAFDSRDLQLAELLRLNLSSRVVMVDQEPYNKSFLQAPGHFYIPPMDNVNKFYTASFDWSNASIHRGALGWQYRFDLPNDFPSYLSTTVFTYDYNSWKLTVNGRVLDPMQGKLTAPYTYDVQNIQEKKLTILLPAGTTPQGDIDLQVKLPDRILGVWKNTYDDLGATYEAPKEGWLVFNYPYDEKWELTIDGRKTPLSKVNRYFMGAPISEGKHQILLRYWPHTSLRLWIFISMMLSIICFFGIMFYSIKREPLNQG